MPGFDKSITHRETGLTFDVEHGENIVLIKFAPDTQKDEGGRSYVTVDLDALRELGTFLIRLADEHEKTVAYERERDTIDIDIPF